MLKLINIGKCKYLLKFKYLLLPHQVGIQLHYFFLYEMSIKYNIYVFI